jgi:hypothetical protein
MYGTNGVDYEFKASILVKIEDLFVSEGRNKISISE